MNLKRLKFAYARGARIQVPEGACRYGADRNSGKWVTVEHPYWTPTQSFRIHPDDASLEYGPLSSDMRRRAIEKDFSEAEICWQRDRLEIPLWEGVWAHLHVDDAGWLVAPDETRMFMLFVAEMMADEGL
jgi:hypothetical protein